MKVNMQKKNIAVGISKLLYFALQNSPEIQFEYVLDVNVAEKEYFGLKVHEYNILQKEDLQNITFYIFAVSNHSIKAIIDRLSKFGVLVEQQVLLYSDIFKKSFSTKIDNCFLQKPDEELYNYVINASMTSNLSVHTTICGTWLFLEMLKYVKKIPGHIVEVGCYEGGNMLVALQSGLVPKEKNVYLLDSFCGFPAVSRFDPSKIKAGDYKPVTTLDNIKTSFNQFKNVEIIPGFVPETFAKLKTQNHYSLVFFDCDLYQPCLDTLSYFWDKLSIGGVFLIHDYFFEPDGFSGVEKATNEFCKKHNIKPIGIWESTMAVLEKKQ